MSSARFDGRRGALPAADTSGLGFAPVTETTIYSTLANGVRFAAGETRDIDLSAEPAVDDSAQALALTVSAKNSADAGWLVVFRCGDPMPPTSNVNFAAERSERRRRSPRSPAPATSACTPAPPPM